MGEVYRARDPKLNRDVAIKVLLPAVADNPDRLVRFSREAQVLASLNHPNIAHIYGFEDGPAADTGRPLHVLVMELVEGPTLADRIAQGPIALDEALPIARQIVEALEAAHEQGIVHRDLKPANIKVRPDGTVKVLDFGLAKAMDPMGLASGSASISPTLTSPALMTAAGVILGTAAYMAPEQAKGRGADKRSDIWAFGTLFYEMLTGRRLFEGEDMMETLAAVVMKEPDLTAAPPAYRRLLRRCLERDPKKRLQHIADVWECVDPETLTVAPAPARRANVLPWLVAGVCAVAAAGVVVYQAIRHPQIAAAPVVSANLTLSLAPAERLGGNGGSYNRPSRTGFAITPDGSTVIFTGLRNGTSLLYRRPLAASDAQPIAGTEGAEYPFISPDGRWVGFATTNKLRKVALGGGPPIDICDLTRRIGGASWGANGTIVMSDVDLWTVPEAGGARTKVLDRTVTESFWSPAMLPDGQTVLFTVHDGDGGWERAHVDAIQLATKKRTAVLTDAADAHYVSTGHLVFMRSATLLATVFDAARVATSGAPVPLLADVGQAINAGNSTNETGMGQFALSDTGVLLYAAGGIYPTPATTLVRVDRQGKATKLADIKGALFGLRVAPDETRVVVFKTNDGNRANDLWSYSLADGLPTRLTTTGDANWPLFGPNGIVFSRFSEDVGIFLVAGDGRPPQRLLQEPAPARAQRIAASWSRDGKWLLYLERAADMTVVYARPMDAPGDPVQVLSSSFQITDAAFSPNGRWIAFRSNESGSDEVYVQPFPGPGDKHRISSVEGANPAWSKDGRQLFYLSRPGSPDMPVQVMAVDIQDTPQFHAGPPHMLFSGFYTNTTPLRSYDVTSNGDFIMGGRAGDPPDEKITALTVVIGWGEELKRRVPVK